MKKITILAISLIGSLLLGGCEGDTQPTDTNACTLEINPVCSIVSSDIQCVTTPCPTGNYQSFDNQCLSDEANAEFSFAGECGQLEGQAVFDTPTECTPERAPVCAAISTIAPCTTVACPSVIHRTYLNLCEAQAANALTIVSNELCGDLEDTSVNDLGPQACTAQFDPVCALDDNPNIACVTEPCDTFSYKTFGNACEAANALADIALSGECGDLEGTMTSGIPPIEISTEALPTVQKQVQLVSVTINNDVLEVAMGYSGCSQQHFELVVSASFLESFPVQADTVFVPQVEDSCEAFWQTNHYYDLRPLKHHYQQAYQSETGTIRLQNLINYTF